jgi:hypothetical protein
MLPHATVIAFGLSILSYVPITHTGVGNTSVFAPKDFFIKDLLVQNVA